MRIVALVESIEKIMNERLFSDMFGDFGLQITGFARVESLPGSIKALVHVCCPIVCPCTSGGRGISNSFLS